MSDQNDTFLGNVLMHTESGLPSGEYVDVMGEKYYRIAHYDQMAPFFMSLVSSSDHWLFISSTGGLTAGRANAESALFPYETDDKVAAHYELTGSKTILRVNRNGRSYLWHPFSNQYNGVYQCDRHLYKNIPGNKLIFEEINHDLDLTARLSWRSSDRFGFVKTSWLQNDGDDACQVELLDGLQNLLPYGITSLTQNTFSNLLHAYKRNELEPETGLGIFTLSATLTDKAEPSESLKATVVWQVGLEQPIHLLCTDQIGAFQNGSLLKPEYDICGKAGAYLVSTILDLQAGESREWHFVAEVNQDSSDVTRLLRLLKREKGMLTAQIEADIAEGTANLSRIVASADGLQISAQQTTSAHHFANVLFNVMRGGIFADGYNIDRKDFCDFIQVRNHALLTIHADWFATLPEKLTIGTLYDQASATEDPDLIRLCYEYLPLTFSRRHGDPSRPWNIFSINLKQEDGTPKLDYQGNWRDIFQNWEPLMLSYPNYIVGMIAKFLNATTADGYNPYRVTRDGIEWEVPEPDNPWANIGYWSDHQIIYLQKLLEIADQVEPGTLVRLWNQPIFAYANVPYRIKPYENMLANWYDTIVFDWDKEKETETAVSQIGTDGRLHLNADGTVHHVTMVEKLLVLLLAKLTNLVPEGGIWMSTQRPEWNDANNALVGKGLSVVTTAYLRRFIAFWQNQLAAANVPSFTVNTAVADLLAQVQSVFTTYQPYLKDGFDNQTRRSVLDELGTAATNYRKGLYQQGIINEQTILSSQALHELLELSQQYIEHTLRANRRPDAMYHAYNILRLDDDQSAAVDNLYLMLEGQVAILSSGMLAADEALDLLLSMRHSDLYRADQQSYMLYPNRKLSGFLQKNNVEAQSVAASNLVAALTEANDGRLLIRDEANRYHFNGRFRNAGDVAAVLAELAQDPKYADLVTAEQDFILDLFEQTFNHRAFTGRSGTFFAYEGLGSIYWHMVSKLLLAVQECYFQAIEDGAETAVVEELGDAYYDIRQGLSFNKPPAVYGAFPTDPYSHSPYGSGAKQPGMTGQVKEEILTRWGELGISVQGGKLFFAPALLKANEFSSESGQFDYVNIAGNQETLSFPANSLAFTFCQTPIIYTIAESAKIEVQDENGRSQLISSNHLDATTSQQILNRDGHIKYLHVFIPLMD
jgi:hypothetical protein